MHNFLASQPDLNFHNPEVQDALLETVRFWLDRGVDGFRLDTVNYYFHDRWLRSNPPLAESVAGILNASNPYMAQEHLFDKTRPENLDFLKRFRALLDEYEGRAAVGEVGDEGRSLDTLAAYTSGGDKLHMCYTFDMLGRCLFAGACTRLRRSLRKQGQGRLGLLGLLQSRCDAPCQPLDAAGRRPGRDGANSPSTLLACLRGSICLYQGEELGLEEAELAYEDLRDPVGIRFWPGIKGRDGCRTPMVWEADAPNAGFSSGKPWLPVAAAAIERAADRQDADMSSVLNYYRDILSRRRAEPALLHGSIEFLPAPDGVLAFVRQLFDRKILCVFNFSHNPIEYVCGVGSIAAAETIFPVANARVSKNIIELAALGNFVTPLL